MTVCGRYGHTWGIVNERGEDGYMIVPVPRPYLWECELCDATHRGDVAPDGTTRDEWFEAHCDALDRADQADAE